MFGVDLFGNLIKMAEGGTGGVTPGGVNNNYIQWCPDISPGPVQPGSGTIRGVGLKTVRLPVRCIWLE